LPPWARPLAWVSKGLFVVATIWLLRSAQALLVPLTVATVLALLLSTPLEHLRRAGLPDYVGAAVLVVVIVVSGLGAAAVLAKPMWEWWTHLPHVLSRVGDVADRLPASLPLDGAVLEVRLGSEFATGPLILSRLLSVHGLRWLIATASTLVLLYFMLACQRTIVERAIEAIGTQRRRAVVLAVMRDARRDTGRFVGALGLIYVGVGILTGCGLAWLGLPDAVLWGALATLLSFLPYLGPLAMVGGLLVVGATTFASLPMAIAPAAWFLALHAIDSNVVSPTFVGRRLALNPVAVLVAVMLLGWLWGMMGALLAVPLLVTFRAGLRRHRPLRWLHACISTA
jgi:predicted PurR-regulated permease PerM